MNALKTVFRTIGAALAGAACVGACTMHEVAAENRTIRAEGKEPMLLTSSGALEIHVLDGRLYEVKPAARTEEAPKVREIHTLADLRNVYREAAGQMLPSESPGHTLQVNGWQGMECVRAAKACGPSPADASQVMVVIRVD